MAHVKSEGAPDAVLIGGGVIGLAIAWRAAQQGLAVTVADPEPGSGASAVAAGMLAPVTEVHPGEEPLLHLNLASSRMYPAWVAELKQVTGLDIGYRRSGTLLVARDVDENAALDEVWRLQESLGLETERLKAHEVRRLEPGLARRVRGGILAAADHSVDAQGLTQALLEACEGAGVMFRAERVEEVLSSEGEVEGVRLASGEAVTCARAVLCAGAWSGRIAGLPEVLETAVRPVKGQLIHLRLRDEAPLFSHSLRGAEVYLVARSGGRVVLGATVEDQGFDTSITAGAVYTLLRDAYEILPGIAEAEVTEVKAGLRPGTPDNAPLLGRTPLRGLLVATGHYRNGILLAPVTAELLVDLLLDKPGSHLLGDFSPSRFRNAGRVPA